MPKFLSYPSSFGEMRKPASSPGTESPPPWSETLQQRTRQTLEDLAVPPDGFLHMKHKLLGYAAINVVEHLQNGTLTCRSKDGSSWTYPDVETLITNGWAID